MDDNVIHHVANETSAYALWTKLEQLYGRKTAENKTRQDLFGACKLEIERWVTDHMNEMQGPDEMQALFLLGSLPDSWETLAVLVSAPDGVLSMSQVKSALLSEETRRKAAGSSSQSEALVTENRGRSKSKGPHHRGNSRSKSPFTIIAANATIVLGHMKKDLRKWKREQKKENAEKKGEDKDRVAITSDDVLIVYDSNLLNLASQETSWVIDSGASIHLTSRRDFFSSYI